MATPSYLLIIDGQQFIRQALPVALVDCGHAHKAVMVGAKFNPNHDERGRFASGPGQSVPWAASMSRDEAEAFAATSVYTQDFEHVTKSENIEPLLGEGFDLERKQSAGIWGEGIYLSAQAETTAMYQSMFGQAYETQTLTLKANVQRPLVIDVTDQAIWGEASAARAMINARGSTVEQFGRWLTDGDYGTRDMAWVITQFVKEGGYDSIRIRSRRWDEGSGGDQLIVFDPKQVVIIRPLATARKAVVREPDDADSRRNRAERKLMLALENLFRDLVPDVAARLAAGEMPTDSELQAAFARVIEPQLVEAAVEEFARLGVELGVQFDPAQANLQAARWARTYTYDLVKGLTETTRATLQDALGRFQETPGMTRAQLEALIEPSFGKIRAEAISITETTRSYQAAMDQYKIELAAYGLDGVLIYHTAHDDLVCPVCSPDNEKPEPEWTGGGKPPRHTRCRCSTSLAVQPVAREKETV